MKSIIQTQLKALRFRILEAKEAAGCGPVSTVLEGLQMDGYGFTIMEKETETGLWDASIGYICPEYLELDGYTEACGGGLRVRVKIMWGSDQLDKLEIEIGEAGHWLKNSDKLASYTKMIKESSNYWKITEINGFEELCNAMFKLAF